MDQIRISSKSDFTAQHYSNILAQAQEKLAQVNVRLEEKTHELEDYQNEILRVIRGESALSPLVLNDAISKAKCEVADLTEAADLAKKELVRCQSNAISGIKEYEKLCNWADMFA